jgi:hypothetical protein
MLIAEDLGSRVGVTVKTCYLPTVGPPTLRRPGPAYLEHSLATVRVSLSIRLVDSY